MYLKSVQVQGFKTFAKKTELFFEPGVTAIVGPNGAGKSNLVDAIRWVLGERSARQLRGTRMEEVVYSGGARRSPSGMAEVRIVIDNGDGRLQVPYGEIEVLRRGYRSGESDYWINGTRCRLRDIEQLFASTGLTQEGYAVVAQDDVDYIIQASNAERRALIEEAAGVRSLQHKREEAMQRLREADQSMVRLADLVQELAPRVEELRAQAETAARHAELSQRLSALRGSLTQAEWRAVRHRLARAEGRVQSLRAEVTRWRQASEQYAQAYAAERERLAAAHDARLARERELGALRLGAIEAGSRAELAAERYHALEARQLAEETAASAAGQRLRRLEMEVEALRGEVEGEPLPERSQAQLVAAEGAAAQAAGAAESARLAVDAARATLDAARGLREGLIARSGRLEERLGALDLLAGREEVPHPRARPLLELIQLNKDLLPALEAALGPDTLRSWVAIDPGSEAELVRAFAGGDLKAGLLRARERLAEPQPRPAPAHARPLREEITAPDWLLPALDILLDHVYLVEDFDAALRLASELPDSTAVTPGGQAVSGPRLKAAASGGLADLSRKRSQAEAELETERKAAEAATEALSIAQRNLTAALQDEEVARAEQARRAGEVAGLRVQALTAANTTAERARVLARAQALLVAQQAELERAGSEAASLRGARDALREELAEAQAAAAQARRELDQVPPRPEGDEVRLVAEAVLQMERENLERQVGLAHQEEALVQAEELERLEQATLAELTERMGGEDADLVAEAEVDWERTQREVSRLERQLAQLGPVNELAIEEYERDRSRLGGIDVQLEDLQRAREDLGQLAGTLGEEIERRFDAVFGAVAFNFQELFGELFAGGRATLSLDRAEGDEPGDAGVEILAQPAGKRMRNIRLLSGGERALTALAFILALEKVNPSPFYVLDEVDAPLDDANVRRFNVMLNSMAAGNQFILVTHNHQTMTSARALYGVTLEDSGVSRVVSVRLQGGEVVAAGEPQSQIVAG